VPCRNNVSATSDVVTDRITATVALARDEATQPCGALLGGAVPQQRLGNQRRGHRQDHGDRRTRACDRFEREHVRHIVRTGTAPLFGDGDAPKPESPGLSDQVARKRVTLVNVRRHGRDDIVGEPTREVRKRLLPIAGGDAHGTQRSRGAALRHSVECDRRVGWL